MNIGKTLFAQIMEFVPGTSFSRNVERYAMGLRHSVRRSTLTDANEARDWRIRADLAALLIRRARKPISFKAHECLTNPVQPAPYRNQRPQSSYLACRNL